MTPLEYKALSTYGDVIREWVGSDRPLEKMRKAGWVVLPSQKATFLDPSGYRVQPQEELNMEQYSKEFWDTCRKMNSMHLSVDIARALYYNLDEIAGWVNGVALEYFDDGKWVPVPKEHHRFTSKQYRKAPPKLKQCDVVVFYRDAMSIGDRVGVAFTMPAGIDVARLPVEPTHPKQATLASLQAKTPGFKLLSITRVAVDDNNNLMEYSTKLDNLGVQGPTLHLHPTK